MAYTQAEVEAIHAAVIALGSGERVASVTVDGMTTQWAITDLDKLRALDREASASVRSGSGRPGFFRISTGSKGV